MSDFKNENILGKEILEKPFDRSEFFQSNEFVEAIKNCEESRKMHAIGFLLEYTVLHPDGYGIDNYLSKIIRLPEHNDDNFQSDLLLDSIVKKLKLENINDKKSQEQIFNYFMENFDNRGYFFHGFSGAFEENIRKLGLSHQERLWDENDLKLLSSFFKESGSMELGWLNINCEGKLSISSSAKPIYRYAVASPEWFAHFISEGPHIPRNKEQKTAYYRGDYNVSFKNIEEVCDKSKYIDEQQKKQIIELFNKYWDKFKSKDYRPCVAMIKKRSIQEESFFSSYDEMAKFLESTDYIKKRDFKDMPTNEWFQRLYHIFTMHIDSRISRTIPVDDFNIVYLPKYNDVISTENK